jgi:hypothetical protein
MKKEWKIFIILFLFIFELIFLANKLYWLSFNISLFKIDKAIILQDN